MKRFWRSTPSAKAVSERAWRERDYWLKERSAEEIALLARSAGLQEDGSVYHVNEKGITTHEKTKSPFCSLCILEKVRANPRRFMALPTEFVKEPKQIRKISNYLHRKGWHGPLDEHSLPPRCWSCEHAHKEAEKLEKESGP